MKRKKQKGKKDGKISRKFSDAWGLLTWGLRKVGGGASPCSFSLKTPKALGIQESSTRGGDSKSAKGRGLENEDIRSTPIRIENIGLHPTKRKEGASKKRKGGGNIPARPCDTGASLTGDQKTQFVHQHQKERKFGEKEEAWRQTCSKRNRVFPTGNIGWGRVGDHGIAAGLGSKEKGEQRARERREPEGSKRKLARRSSES